jgi:glutamyl-tRNA synthetase
MALFNWAFSKKHGGDFILRIEDTDQARSTRESEQVIYDALRWLGLEWDEGPDVGGPHGPYRQSERRATYLEYSDKLVNDGHAFHCFCSKERLDQVRRTQQLNKETTRYDGHCLELSSQEVAARIEDGHEHVVRMKVPSGGDCVFTDVLRGEISIPFQQVDMQVLIKADGMPTYHLAVVVDDHLMGITHIMRGEEWINSVPKHKLLAGYLGWELPTLTHLPLLRNPDQSKLSKRKNPTSITFYRDAGYLPEALLNYLGLMGWSMPDEREIFSKEEMVTVFDEQRISLRGPIFDQAKLNWMNGQYLRDLSDSDYAGRIGEWMLNADKLAPLVPLIKERAERLSDVVPQVGYLLGERPELGTEDFAHKSLQPEQVVKILHHTLASFDLAPNWEREALFELCQQLAVACDIKFRDFLFPLFVAISGRPVSLDLFDSFVFLGSNLSRARVRRAMSELNVSGKMQKKLDKELAVIRPAIGL